jgi:adenine-specific DNA-methyltransferase
VRFSLASESVIATQDVTAFAPLLGTRESISYIVGFLNLPSVSDWIRVFGLMKGGVAEFSEKPLSEIPFRRIDWANEDEIRAHQKISQLVDSARISGGFSRDFEDQIIAEFQKLMPGLA